MSEAINRAIANVNAILAQFDPSRYVQSEDGAIKIIKEDQDGNLVPSILTGADRAFYAWALDLQDALPALSEAAGVALPAGFTDRVTHEDPAQGEVPEWGAVSPQGVSYILIHPGDNVPGSITTPSGHLLAPESEVIKWAQARHSALDKFMVNLPVYAAVAAGTAAASGALDAFSLEAGAAPAGETLTPEFFQSPTPGPGALETPGLDYGVDLEQASAALDTGIVPAGAGSFVPDFLKPAAAEAARTATGAAVTAAKGAATTAIVKALAPSPARPASAQVPAPTSYLPFLPFLPDAGHAPAAAPAAGGGLTAGNRAGMLTVFALALGAVALTGRGARKRASHRR